MTRDVAKDADQTALVERYKAIAGPIGDRQIGTAAAAITRDATPAGESALGDVIADSQLEATQPAGFGGAQIAFMNPGGIRADLAAGPVTLAEAFTIQPFGDSLVTPTLTGAQIERVLAQQVFPSDPANGAGTIPSTTSSPTAATGSPSCARGPTGSAARSTSTHSRRTSPRTPRSRRGRGTASRRAGA